MVGTASRPVLNDRTVLGLGGVEPAKLPADSIFVTLRREGEPAIIPPGWRWATLQDHLIYLHACYGRAFYWIEEHDKRARRHHEPSGIAGALLVHGTIVAPGEPGPIGHAWVELPGDVAFDGVTQGFYTRESYYRLTAAQPLLRYLFTTARRLRKQRGHLEPWHESEEALVSA